VCGAFSLLAFNEAAQGERLASPAWVAAGVFGAAAAAGALLVRRRREGFFARESGLEVRRPGDRGAVISWERIRAAEYRLFLGGEMALWLAVEGEDGEIPAAPLVAETGVALLTRYRAMPQFLLCLADRLGGGVAFLLPILAVAPSRRRSPRAGKAFAPSGDGPARAASSDECRALAVPSSLASSLVSGTLAEKELSLSLAEPGENA
jgi:hypothetical protein